MKRFNEIQNSLKKWTYYTICGSRLLIDLGAAVFAVYGFSYFIKISDSVFLTAASIFFLFFALFILGLDSYHTIKNIREIRNNYQNKKEDNKSKIEF